MHKTPSPHASRIFTALAAAGALLLAGCGLTITNVTPPEAHANPSQIYTITAQFHTDSDSIPSASIHPRIVIDGQSYDMTRSSTIGSDLWAFEYQLPAGRNTANYYFIADYGVKSGDQIVPKQSTSDLQTLTISGRYALGPEANRAPVGARVSMLGAGFTPTDVVYFDQNPTRTVFESPSSLSFFVPAIEAGRSYQLHVTGGGADLAVGTFRVDGITFQVDPTSLTLRTGEQQRLTFTIPTPAPAGGMLVDVKTDVPKSVIMPEVMIAAGAMSASVVIQGGEPGTGSIYFKSSAGESSIPLTVTAR
ncbi:MAG TPA: cell surface protein [Candidatus Didemnitutus sp.]|nr:cell surface protein [Candidatus Didemnitutus sp.]